jgi:hypothetical protein
MTKEVRWIQQKSEFSGGIDGEQGKPGKLASIEDQKVR